MLGEFDPSELSAVPIRREENNHGRGRVPLMAGAYLLLAAVVTVMNITLVPEVN